MSPDLEYVVLTSCVNCDSPLPPLKLDAHSSWQIWECCACGTTYEGMLDGPLEDVRSRLKLLHYFPASARSASAVPEYDGKERRRHQRRPIMVAIPAIQLDENLLPVGQEFKLVSRNLSEGGASLIHHAPLQGSFALLVDLQDDGRVQIIFRVLRCNQIGDLFEIGGEFVERLD